MVKTDIASHEEAPSESLFAKSVKEHPINSYKNQFDEYMALIKEIITHGISRDENFDSNENEDIAMYIAQEVVYFVKIISYFLAYRIISFLY